MYFKGSIHMLPSAWKIGNMIFIIRRNMKNKNMTKAELYQKIPTGPYFDDIGPCTKITFLSPQKSRVLKAPNP